MIPCHQIQQDHLEIRFMEIKQYYFKKKYIKSAELINTLVIDVSKFKYLSSLKKDIITYKRLIDFRIEDHILKSKVEIF